MPPKVAAAVHDPQGWVVLGGGLVGSLMAPELCIGQGLDLVPCNDSSTAAVWTHNSASSTLHGRRVL